MRTPAVTVVIPVRNAADLVHGCLDALTPEVAGDVAEVVVVDDASTDETPDRVTEHPIGARLMRLDRRHGPYGAREVGWRSSAGDVVVFLDVRCRVRTGWLQALMTPLEDPGLAIAGNGYVTLPGTTLAGRAAARQDGFRPAASLEGEPLPFVPGGNMAVRRPALEAVGGLAASLASGGDAVLCWAVQLDGLGLVTGAPGADVDWVPRDRVRDFVRQRAKYGRARVDIELRFQPRLPPPALPATFPLITHLVGLARRVRAGGEARTEAVIALAEYAYARAYRTAYLRRARNGDVPPARRRSQVLVSSLRR